MALLAMQVVAPASAPDDDIVVMARQLSKVRFTYHAKDGRLLSCDVERSVNAVVDAIVCDAARQCAAENPALGDGHLVPCIKDRVRSLAAADRANRATLPEGQ